MSHAKPAGPLTAAFSSSTDGECFAQPADLGRGEAAPRIKEVQLGEQALPGAQILAPGASWEGTISARGALVAGSWVRVVFGPLVSVGEPPAKLEDNVVWISDVAYRLR